MKRRIFFVSVSVSASVLASVWSSVFALSSAGAAEPAVSEALKTLQGTWVAESEELEGTATPPDRLERKLVVEGDSFTNIFRRGPGLHESRGKLVLGEAGGFPTMDLVGKEFERKAIYKLAGGKLSICVQHDPSGERPKSFATTPGSGYGVAVYVRQSTAKD